MTFLANSSTRFVELQKMMDWLICNWGNDQTDDAGEEGEYIPLRRGC